MFPCAYCERPLTCAACRAPFTPATAEEYAALSHAEEPIACPACERLLVCHWCRTPYDGGARVDDGPDAE